MRARWAAIGAAAAAVALSLWWPRVSLSPGALSAGHARYRDDCLQCHALGAGAPTSKCVACHPIDRIGSARGASGSAAEPAAEAVGATTRSRLAGMHGAFRGIACGECHTDHAGASPAAATHRFSHEALSAEVRNRCAVCHAPERPADAIHQGAGEACGACHTVRAWKPATFEHDRFFVLDRDHNTACATCHDRPGDYRAYTCYGCHEHTAARMESKHVKEGIRDFANCVRCHKSAAEHEGREGGGEGEGERGRGEGERGRGEGERGDDD